MNVLLSRFTKQFRMYFQNKACRQKTVVFCVINVCCCARVYGLSVDALAFKVVGHIAVILFFVYTSSPPHMAEVFNQSPTQIFWEVFSQTAIIE